MNYYSKYIKYKSKYLYLKNNKIGGYNCVETDGQATGKKIKFISRMRKSWKVEISPDIKYSNPRAPHVETNMDGLENREVILGKRCQIKNGTNIVVMYSTPNITNINPITNQEETAHITLYFGPAEGSELY